MIGLLRRPRGMMATVLSVAPANRVAYWPLDDAGTTARDATGSGRDGAYAGSPARSTGIGDGRTAPVFDASTTYVDIYSASLAGAFNGNEGSLSFWFKVNAAGVWTDATSRRLVTLQADANNRYLIQRTTTNNQMNWFTVAGGTNKTIAKTTSGPTGWVHIGLTWSKTGNALQPYYNGAAEGSVVTGLGTFTGSLGSGLVAIGGTTTPSAVWSGQIAHLAIWNTPLSAAQMLRLATV